MANLPTFGEIGSSQITDQSGLQLTAAGSGNTVTARPKVNTAVAAQQVGVGLQNLILQPNMPSGKRVHLQMPVNIIPRMNTTGAVFQQRIITPTIVQRNKSRGVNVPTCTNQFLQSANNAQTVGATVSTHLVDFQGLGPSTSTIQASTYLPAGQIRAGIVLPTQAANPNLFQDTNPVTDSKLAQILSWHTATLQGAQEQNRNITTLTSSQSNAQQASSQNIRSNSPAIGARLRTARTEYRIKASPCQILKPTSRMPNPLALEKTNPTNVVIVTRTLTPPLANVSTQSLDTNSEVRAIGDNQMETQKASPTYNTITIQRNQQTPSPAASSSPQCSQQHVEMRSVSQRNTSNQPDVQRGNITLNAPQQIVVSQLATQRASSTCSTLTRHGNQQTPSAVGSLNPQHSQQHVHLRSILQHNIPREHIVQRSNIPSNACMQGSSQVVRTPGRSYLTIAGKIHNDGNIQGANPNLAISPLSSSRPQTEHDRVAPQNNLCENKSSGKKVRQTQDEKQSDKNVLKSLLQTSSTEKQPMRHTPTTASSSLYANPFLTSQVPAVQKTKYHDIPAHTLDALQKPTTKDDDEACYRIEAEDEGYTIFIEQKDKNEKSNKQKRKADKRAEYTDTTLSLNDFNLEIDLSRLEDINKELNQLISSAQAPGQSKELELIQQEQKKEEETTGLNTFKQIADEMLLCEETIQTKKAGKEMQILTAEPNKEQSDSLEPTRELSELERLLNAEKKFEESVKNLSKEMELIAMEQELIAMEQKKKELERTKLLQQTQIHRKNTYSSEKVRQSKEMKGETQHTLSVGSTKEVTQSITEQENKWRKAFGLPAVDKIKQKNSELKGPSAEKQTERSHHNINKWWKENDTPKNIVKKVLLGRITDFLAQKPPFRTIKLEDAADLLNKSEVLAVKNITKTLRTIVEGFEQEVTTSGMEYGEKIYFETLKLTTKIKSNIIPRLNKIQKEENGLWTQVLLVMLKDKLTSVHPSLRDQLYDTQESLHALLPTPGVAQAVEDALANFESKYVDAVFNNESYRRASCLLVYRLRRMLARHLYWFETPVTIDCDFQLDYSLRKLIFLHISEFVGQLAPGLKHAVRDIHALRKLSETRKDVYRVIDFCMGKFSQGKTGLFFQTLTNVLLDIRRAVAGVFCLDQSPTVQYTFQNLGLVKEVETNLKPEQLYPDFLVVMNNLLSNLRVSQGQYMGLKNALFHNSDFVHPRLSGSNSAPLNATINQTLNSVKRVNRPSIIPAQRFKGKTVHVSVDGNAGVPVWTAAYEETSTKSPSAPTIKLKGQKIKATVEVPNRAIDHKIPKQKCPIGMVVDERSNLSLYKSVSKEMKAGLRKSKTDVLELIRENKLLMFSGLIETFLRKPMEWDPSETESDDEIVNESKKGTREREPTPGDTGGSPEGETNFDITRAEVGQIGNNDIVRIKEEPKDSGVYGISSVLPTDIEEIRRQIKVEPGLEKTIKQEKDSNWVNSDLVTNIKTEPADPDLSSVEHCQRCPVFSRPVDNEVYEPSSEIALVNSEIPPRTTEDTCSKQAVSETTCEKQPREPEVRSAQPEGSSERLDHSVDVRDGEGNLHLQSSQISKKSEVENDGVSRVTKSQAGEGEPDAEPLETPNKYLEDILSKTVDQIFATIRCEENRKESGYTSDNEADRRKAEPCREEEHEADTADTTPLRHSVEYRRQEALQFLKELSNLQNVELEVSSENNKVDEHKRRECNNTEVAGKKNTSVVSAVKVRKSVELDKILSETVNQIYSEIHGGTSSVTKTMNAGSLDVKETERVTDEAMQLDCGDNADERANDSSTSDKHALNHKATADQETAVDSMMTSNTDVQPTSSNTELPISDECINTNSDVVPIIIEPDGECEDMERENMQPDHDTVEENAIKTEDVEFDGHVKADTTCEFLVNNRQEVTTINIEPIDCEAYQQPEVSESVKISEHLEIKEEPVDKNPMTVLDSKSGANDNEDSGLDDARKEPTQIIGQISIGSCTAEGGDENRILSSLLKNDAKRQKNKRKAEKRREKIEELRKYYKEQIRIIREARLDIYTDREEILEQLGYLKENRKLVVELGVDSAEIFGCYICGFTAAAQEEIMQHWMKVHLEDYLYVCPFCDLDLATSCDVVTHIMEWHPKRPVRVCLKPSEIYQDRIELEFGISNTSQSSDQCFIVDARKECFSVDNIENDSKRYECQECEYFCTDLALIRKHVKLAHTPGVRFECPQCKLYYRSFRAVQVHMLKDHLGTKVSTQSLISHLVSAEAIVPLDRLNWERIKLETTSSLDYAARYDDVIHEFLNVSEKTCWDVCTTDFDSLFLLCKMCFHTHTEPEKMWKHVRETHGLPKFVDCPKCRNTIEVTTDERYTCLTFCRECRLLLTLKVEQGKEVLRIDNMYACRSCAFRSGDINVIQQHVTQMHLQLKPYRCKYCRMTNAVKHIVKRHIAEIHPGQPSKVITDVQQMAQMTNELGCAYKSYQLVVYKDVTSSVCEKGDSKCKRRRHGRKLQDITNVDGEGGEEEFIEGEDLNTVLAGCFGKPVVISESTGQTKECKIMPGPPEPLTRSVPSNPVVTKNITMIDHFKCKLCNYVCTLRSSVNRHVKRHFKIYPYKCFYCNFEHGERDKVMKHTMKSHPNNENLVYTDQSVLDAFTQEVDKYITKFKGYGTKNPQSTKKYSPFSHLMSSLSKQQRGKKGQSSGQKKASGVKSDSVLKSLVEKLPIKEKPAQGGPSWEQKSSDDDSWWELNKDLESSSDESYQAKASSSGIASQMKSELMLKLQRSGVSNQWKTARRPTSEKRQKRSQGTSQRKRKRYQVIDDADSDDSWSRDSRRRKRSKRQEKKKRTTRRARLESSGNSDWMSEFLSDSESDTTGRKPKVKAVEYKLSDEDFRSNYAFLLNDDKLLEDPVVKLVPIEMDGPVYIVKDRRAPTVEVKVEPQDIQDDTPMLFMGGLDALVGTFAKSEMDVEQETEMWKSNIRDQTRHPDTTFGEEKTVVELFTGGERTVVEATIEYAGTFNQPVGHFSLLSGKNVENTLSGATAEHEEVSQTPQSEGISQLKDFPINAETCSIPRNISNETVHHTEINHPVVEGNNSLSEVKTHRIHTSSEREVDKCEGISQTVPKDENDLKQGEVRNTMVKTNETVRQKVTCQTTKRTKNITNEGKLRNIWSILDDPVQLAEMAKTDAEIESIPGDIKPHTIEASFVNKAVETEQNQSTAPAGNIHMVTERSGASVNVAEHDQDLVKLQWNLDPVSGRFVEGNGQEDGLTNDSLLKRDEIKQESVLDKKNVPETDLKTTESVLENRTRCKIREKTTTKPKPSACNESGQKVVSSSPAKVSNHRHKWTDEELRIYHGHLNSDPLLVQKPVVILEELDIVDIVYEDE